MIQIIKFILFLIVISYAIYLLIRMQILDKNIEKKLKEVTNVEEFKKFYEKN